MTTNRTYTTAEKQAAIARTLAIGPVAAGRELGVPSGTLSCWAHRARRGGPGDAPVDDQQDAGATDEQEAELERPAEAEEVPEADDVAEGGSSRGNIARLYTPLEKARALELAAKVGVTAASKKLGISRFSLYAWRRRVERAASGEGDSPTAGPDPADIEAQRDKEILDLWHQHPGLGPSQIRNQLRRQGVKVAVNTDRRVMEDAGYRPPKVERDAHDERYEAVRPNHLWHLDFVHRNINRTHTFTLILIDDHSRFVVGHGVDDAERADMVIDAFSEAVERHGRPEAGISRFTALLTELGVV